MTSGEPKKKRRKKETFRIVLSTSENGSEYTALLEGLLWSPSTQPCPGVWTRDLISGVVRCNSACVDSLCPQTCLLPFLANLWYLAGTGPVAVISWLPSLFLELSLVSSVALNPCSEIRVGWFRMWVQQGWERNLPNKSVAWKELHLSALAVLFPLSQSLF